MDERYTHQPEPRKWVFLYVGFYCMTYGKDEVKTVLPVLKETNNIFKPGEKQSFNFITYFSNVQGIHKI